MATTAIATAPAPVGATVSTATAPAELLMEEEDFLRANTVGLLYHVSGGTE
jgi:hypothetical protein